MAIRPWGIPPFDAIIIRGELLFARTIWCNHHQGRIAIRPYKLKNNGVEISKEIEPLIEE